MKLRILLLCALMLPMLANAEIYKWKDKEGKIRYSDVPPPSNVQQETLNGKKVAKPTGQAPLAEVEGDATVAQNKQKALDKAAGDKTAVLTKEQAAAKRAKDAEEQKIKDETKQANQKAKEENCTNAKNNLVIYTTGGRIAKVNEKGEREFMGDTEIKNSKMQAQKDVDKFCN